MTIEQKVIRKLRAILSADVKGYSLLMTKDESSTIKTLKEYRHIMSEIITQHSGRVVDAPGDNLLAEFSSVVNAVQCSVEIQKALTARNAEMQKDKRLEFRIGINIGDVVQDGKSLYGEGVNIAARIEGLADPGGVCISRGAYDQVKNKLKLGYEFIGEHSVKNIKDPVRVYKVLMESKDAGKLIGDEPKPLLKSGTWATVIVAAFVLILIGYQVFNKTIAPEFEPASIEKIAFPLPDKPSIAVLPFDNMSGGKELEYFSDGITEDIISALSKTSKLFVIARNSTFTYKGKSVKVQEIGRDLGVRYVLEGSVRKSENRVRITAQLIDTQTGHHLWAERYDRDLKDIFALQDEITIKIISALQVKLTDGEIARIGDRGTKNIEAYFKVQEAKQFLYTANKEGISKARSIFKEAIELDPNYAWSYNYLGATYWLDVVQGNSPSPNESIKLAFESLEKAKVLDDSIPLSQLGFLYIMVKQYEKGIAECERAVELDPNSGNTHMWMSLVLNYVGRHEEAIQHAEKAIQLDPLGPNWYFRQLGNTYSWVGRYKDAIAAFKKSLEGSPDDIMTHLNLTVTYVWAEYLEQARAQGVEVMRINPNFTIGQMAKRSPFRNQADLERYFEAMHKAGLPN